MLLQTDVRRSYPVSYLTTPPYTSRRVTLKYSTVFAQQNVFNCRRLECVRSGLWIVVVIIVVS